jgi:membrane AbrB-like protein
MTVGTFDRVCSGLEKRPWTRLAFTLVIGAIGGFAASAIKMPLAWMLGPFIATAAVSLSGVPLRAIPHGREVGQVIVGLSVGMRFTVSVLAATFALLPAMFVSITAVMVLTTLAAFILIPIARVDRTTAFFATAAAGMADMAAIAEHRGGNPSAVAVVHAIRVALVVLSIPLLVYAFGEHGTVAQTVSTARGDLHLVALVIVLGYCASWLFGLTHFPNPWLIGGVLFGGILGVTDILVVSIPRIILIVSQLAIGVSLGAKFERELIVKLPRVALGAVIVSVILILAAAAGAWLLSELTGLPYSVALLSIAPAAVTEMTLTAQAMGIDAQIVTAFHVMRVSLVEVSILVVYAVFQKISGATLKAEE